MDAMGSRRIWAGVAAGLAALVAWTSHAASEAAPPTVHGWMTGAVAPRGDALSNTVLKAMNDQGKPDASGMTAADWAQIIEAAEALKASVGPVTEAAVLRVAADGVKIQGEGQEGQNTAAQVQGFIDKDRAGFNGLAQGLARTSDAFVAAARAKDPAKLIAASVDLDAACQACHSKFWYPQP